MSASNKVDAKRQAECLGVDRNKPQEASLKSPASRLLSFEMDESVRESTAKRIVRRPFQLWDVDFQNGDRSSMELTITSAIQLFVALGLLNVWLIRARSMTAYRGGSSNTLKGEFEAYGLPSWAFYVVGALKIGVAIALIAGLWRPSLVVPSAIALSVLMIGAIIMHMRVRDPLKRSIPATAMLAMCAALLFV